MENLSTFRGIENRLNDRVFRALMENANDAIFVLDTEGKILNANRQAERLLGFSKKQMEGMRYHDFVIPEDRDYAVSRVGTVVEGNPVTHDEVLLRGADGTPICVDFSAVLIDLGNEKVMMGIGRDITDQKKAEVERARYAAIVEASDDAIYAIDLEGNINAWNPGAEKLFGYAAKEILGHHLFMIVPADRHQEMVRVLETCKRGQPTSHLETFRKGRLQEKTPISVNWFPIRNSQGEVVGVSAIVRDLTEREEGFFLTRKEQ